ncbi:MAG: hypothetical protein AB1736_01910 [Chloroflexota bacterium]
MVVVAWAVGTSVIAYRPSVNCTGSGSPYLDPGIPDECERGQRPQFDGTMPPDYLPTISPAD